MPSLVQVLLRKDADDIAEVFARVRGRRHSEPASSPAPPENWLLAPAQAGAVPKPHDTHSGSARARLTVGPQSSRGPGGLASELEGQSPCHPGG